VVLLITQCELVLGENVVGLFPDQACYILGSSPIANLEISNDTDSPVYYVCTGQIYLEELRLKGLRGSWLVHGFEECYTPTSVDQAGTEIFEIDLKSLFESGLLAGATFDETVSYRFKMELYKDELFKNILDEDQCISAEFQIMQK